MDKKEISLERKQYLKKIKKKKLIGLFIVLMGVFIYSI